MGFLATIFGVDEAQSAEEASRDAWLKARNEELHRRGLLSDANYELSNRQIDDDNIGDVDAELNASFNEGLAEGRDNISGVVRVPFTLAGYGIAAILKGIPWWVWLSVVGYVAFRLGLLNSLLKKAR